MRNGHEIDKLIEPGRVHRSVYTDPELFELEMERIFGRAWLFVGHESQVPHAGDYITTELGRQPVIMVRHRDGSINVLLNRSTHRGAKVVNERKGNAARLTCCYHGWSFDTDGRLAAVPVPEGCAADFDQAAFGLAHAPRVGAYRGFVFASLGAQELHRRQRPWLDQQHFARRRQALEPGLRRIQARAGGEDRRRAGATDPHPAPA